jgi:hypothetical protein
MRDGECRNSPDAALQVQLNAEIQFSFNGLAVVYHSGVIHN